MEIDCFDYPNIADGRNCKYVWVVGDKVVKTRVDPNYQHKTVFKAMGWTVIFLNEMHVGCGLIYQDFVCGFPVSLLFDLQTLRENFKEKFYQIESLWYDCDAYEVWDEIWYDIYKALYRQGACVDDLHIGNAVCNPIAQEIYVYDW